MFAGHSFCRFCHGMPLMYIVVGKSVFRCVTGEGHFPSFLATDTSKNLSKIDVTCISLLLARLNYNGADQ